MITRSPTLLLNALSTTFSPLTLAPAFRRSRGPEDQGFGRRAELALLPEWKVGNEKWIRSTCERLVPILQKVIAKWRYFCASSICSMAGEYGVVDAQWYGVESHSRSWSVLVRTISSFRTWAQMTSPSLLSRSQPVVLKTVGFQSAREPGLATSMYNGGEKKSHAPMLTRPR